MPMTLGHCSKIQSMCIWNTSWLIFMPKGILLYRNLPWVIVLKMVNSLLFLERCTCKKALNAFPFVKYLAPANSWAIYSTVGGV